MKKNILTLSALLFCSLVAVAQSDKNHAISNAAHPTAQNEPATAAETMKFKTEEHSFGTVPEGPAVSYDFEFTNTGSTPIVLSNVQASCGCTTPTWPKEPIVPGQTSKITATFNTQGRPGAINKTITVTSNAGTKILRITGTVEKAPESSVPSNNSSMMKR